MPSPPSTFAAALAAGNDIARAARRLRDAARLVERDAPEGRQKDAVLTGIDRLVVDLENQEATGICRRCRAEFTYRLMWFLERGYEPPRHCETCRQRKRGERHFCGISASAPIPPRD
jgi:hypothetical protein